MEFQPHPNDQRAADPVPIDFDALAVGTGVIVPVGEVYRYGVVERIDEQYEPETNEVIGAAVTVRWWDTVDRRWRISRFALLDVCYYDARNR
jgi:hypothetical protein